MNTVLIVDANEQGHAGANGIDLRKYFEQQTLLTTEVGHLHVGDAALVLRGGDDGDRCVALFERKAGPDMVSSIKAGDNRYRSQAARLEASGVPHVFWVLVDNPPLRDPADALCVSHAMMHLASPAYPHITPVRVADSMGAYADLIKTMAAYIGDVLQGNALADVPLHTVAQAAGARVRLDTQPVVWREQLTLVRGMSRPSAAAVAARYPTAVSLLRALRRAADAHAARPPPPPRKGRKRPPPSLDDELDAVLADVPLGKGGRVGPARAAAVRRTLVPDAAELAAVLP